MICPANQVLKYSTTNKEGYRKYKSDAKTCKNCSLLSQCTNSKNCVKVITSHVWSKYMELAEEYRYVPKYRDIYKLRSQTIERVFADAKKKHAMRYTRMSG